LVGGEIVCLVVLLYVDVSLEDCDRLNELLVLSLLGLLLVVLLSLLLGLLLLELFRLWLLLLDFLLLLDGDGEGELSLLLELVDLLLSEGSDLGDEVFIELVT
jgi:hypothetical protein